MTRPIHNRNGGDRYDTDPRIIDLTISEMTRDNSADIGRVVTVLVRIAEISASWTVGFWGIN